MDIDRAIANATKLLEGLCVGDDFGELFFRLSSYGTSFEDLPTYAWKWTDDTHMALSIVDILKIYHQFDQDELAQAFAEDTSKIRAVAMPEERIVCWVKLHTVPIGVTSHPLYWQWFLW